MKQSVPANTSSTVDLMHGTFFNEIYFYGSIWKTYEEFTKNFSEVKVLQIVPKCYAISSVSGKEKILLENLKFLGFKMYPRVKTFDKMHVEFLLKMYGQFHGTSAAFRERYPEKYAIISNSLHNSVDLVVNLNFFKKFSVAFMKQTEAMIENEKVKKMMKKYTEKPWEIFREASKYRGKNSVINHLDSWSNNMMF